MMLSVPTRRLIIPRRAAQCRRRATLAAASVYVAAHPPTPFPDDFLPRLRDTQRCHPCSIFSQRAVTAAVVKRNKTASAAAPKKASSGRVAWRDEGRRKRGSSGTPRLCSGCGVEIVAGGSGGNGAYGEGRGGRMEAGEDVAKSEENLSKKQKKMARFANIEDSASNTILCARCRSLQGGDVWAAYDALKDVDAKVFSSQLSHIVSRRKFGLCVVVVDAVDPEFSAVKRLREMIRSTPCILAINKVDLLPRRMNRHDLGYVRERVEKGRVKMIGAYGVSAATGEGVVELAEGILRRLGGRDVFVVGAANVGKSTLVKSLSSLLARTLKMHGRSKYIDDKRREMLQNLRVTASHLPGTTLQAVRVPCFSSTRYALWDTPGIINRSALSYSLFPSHLMEPLAFPTPIPIPSEENGRKVRVHEGRSILIDAGWVIDENSSGSSDDPVDWDAQFTLARLDIVETNGMPVEALAYVPSCLKIRIVPTELAPEVAAIPQMYVEKVQNLVGGAGNFREGEVSRPLDIFKGYDDGSMKEAGVIHFDPERDTTIPGGWIRRDVVFAGLGWIMLNHRRPFAVRPWVARDSLWSKRRAMYPSNLEDLKEEFHSDVDGWDGGSSNIDSTANFATMDDNDSIFKEIKMRLQEAAERGRHEADAEGRRRRLAGGKERVSAGLKGAPLHGDASLNSEEIDDDDEWWSA